MLIVADADESGFVSHEHGIGEHHLVGLGHKDFVRITGPETWSAARNRLCAVGAALERHDLAPARIVHGDWSACSGHEVFAALDRLPTAVVAANDQMTLGALHAFSSRGLRVPADVSVTGIDDTPESAYFALALKTIRLDFDAQGRDALLDLLAEIDDPAEDVRTTRPHATLVLRASTGPARRAG